MSNTNIFTQTHWVVHYRDDRPNEIYDNVDDTWAVSVTETETGRPQPFIRTVSPASTTTS